MRILLHLLENFFKRNPLCIQVRDCNRRKKVPILSNHLMCTLKYLFWLKLFSLIWFFMKKKISLCLENRLSHLCISCFEHLINFWCVTADVVARFIQHKSSSPKKYIHTSWDQEANFHVLSKKTSNYAVFFSHKKNDLEDVHSLAPKKPKKWGVTHSRKLVEVAFFFITGFGTH